MMESLRTSFGEFVGRRGEDVVQYLGIKYAQLQDRLAVPEMIEQYGDGIVDARNFGPRTISMEACHFEQSTLIQQTIDTPPAPPMSGVNCLNLNITIPETRPEKPLPVMVFVHGGGFVIGSNWWPQYDPARLVKLSSEVGTPIIAVNFNYRLAVTGSLTSEELRKAGYPGNNCLRDQRCALQWVSTHIAGFGGDPSSITLFGESAGAASVLTHLFSKEPFFNRAISMSGTPLMVKPITPMASEKSYNVMMEQLGLADATVEARIERLLTIDPDELVEKTPMQIPLVPFLDGDLVPEQTTFELLLKADKLFPGTEWCTELMIGDCKHDGNVFAHMGLMERRSGIGAAFCTSLSRSLGDYAANLILVAYGINATTPDQQAWELILEFARDIAYHLPAVVFGRSFPGNTYSYRFDEPNPWEGMFKGQSTHMLDAAFLFQNYNDKLDEGAKAVAISLAKDFISFANGIAPWRSNDELAGEVKVFKQNGVDEKDFIPTNGGDRKDVLLQLSMEGVIKLDEASIAWDNFLLGR